MKYCIGLKLSFERLLNGIHKVSLLLLATAAFIVHGTVYANTAPVVGAIADQTTAEDALFSLPIAGTDADGDALTYRLKSDSPSWLSLINTSEAMVTTLAGSTRGSDDGTSGNAKFNDPYGVTVDAQGNVYVTDTDNHRIRKITPSGVVTTLAGSTQGFNDDTGSDAQFNNPYGVTVDAQGNVYVADTDNHRIRKITPSGVVTTLAGSTQGFNDDTGSDAQFNTPTGVAVDSKGDVYVGDQGNHRIRKITPNGMVTTLAGSGVNGFEDGLGTSAKFSSPDGLAVDNQGNVYVADANNHRIRKITPNGAVTTLAGSAKGFNDDTGSSAQFYYPRGVAVDSQGNVYVVDRRNYRIRKVTASGVVTTLAGSTRGFNDGTGSNAQFTNSYGVAVDDQGDVYVADQGNHRIRKIAQAGFKLSGTPTNAEVGEYTVCVIANDGTNDSAEQCFKLTVTSVNDAPVAQAQTVSTLENIAKAITLTGTDVDNADNSLTFTVVAQPSNGQLTGTAPNLTYTPNVDYKGADSFTYKVNDGALDSSTETITINVTAKPVVDNIADQTSAEDALFSLPISGTDADGDALSYRLDSDSPSWLKLESFSVIKTIVGGGNSSDENVSATSVQLNNPTQILFDSTGNLYITSQHEHRIRKVNVAESGSCNPICLIGTNSKVTTVAGTTMGFGGDGSKAISANLKHPKGISLNNSGALYIADTGNYRIRHVDLSTGDIVTAFGTGGRGFLGDGGDASLAEFYDPGGLTLTDGNLYIADTRNNRIRKVDLGTKVISTIAGGGNSLDNNILATSAELSRPKRVVLDGEGNLYIADTGNHIIRKIDVVTGNIVTVAGNGIGGYNGDNIPATAANLNYPSDVAIDDNNNLYIADSHNHRIRKINTKTGIISTIVGSGSSDFSGDDDDALSAKLSYPGDVVLDSLGNLYIADTANDRIRKIVKSIKITGTPTNDDVGEHTVCVIANDGTNDSAEECFKLTVTNVNDAPVAQAQTVSTLENTTKAITLTGTDIDNADNSLTFTVVAQPSNGQLTGTAPNLTYTPNVDYKGADSFTYQVNDGALDSSTVTITINVTAKPVVDNIADQTSVEDALFSLPGTGYSGDGGALSYRLTSGSPSWLSLTKKASSIITTIAGKGEYIPVFIKPTEFINQLELSNSLQATPALEVQLNSPTGIALGKNGDVYFADTQADRILKVDVKGVVTTVAGSSTASSLGDGGLATEARLQAPQSLVADNRAANSVLYIADQGHHRIRKIDTATGIITTVAGEGTAGSLGDNGAATSAQLNAPRGLVLYTTEKETFLYVAELEGHQVRKVNIDTGLITTVAGNGNSGFAGDNGEATIAELNGPVALAVDSLGNLYIADFYNHRIRKLDIQSNIITTYAGSNSSGFSGDFGSAITAQLQSPEGIVFDRADNLYISDGGNQRIRKVNASTGNIETVVGTGTRGFAGDNGHPISARLDRPNRLALDDAHNLYIVDSNNGRIRKVTPGGYTLSGTPSNAEVGEHTVCVIANDGTNDSAEQCFKLTVTNVNDAPTITGTPATSIEAGKGYRFVANAQDIDVGDTLTFTITNKPAWATFDVVTGTLSGSPSNSDLGTTSNIVISVSDGVASVSLAAFSIEVTAASTPDPDPTPSNAVPVITQGESIGLSVAEGQSGSISLSATDVDGDTLTWQLASNASSGSATVNVNSGIVTYRAIASASKSDSFIVAVSDGQATDSITVNVTIQTKNNAPIAVNDNVTVEQNSTGNLVDVLANDTDPDNDPLSVTTASANSGNVIINSNGTLSYSPAQNYLGQDSISYQISDGKGGTANGVVVITVAKSVNLPPIAVDDSVTLTNNQAITIDVLANDTDPENDELTVVGASSSFGQATVVDNQVAFVPDSAINGQFTIFYTIKDSVDNNAAAQVIVNFDNSLGPNITVPQDLCGELTVNANALYTRVELGQAAAVDRFGNVIPVSLVDGVTLFPPGLNTAAWQATDADGNTTVAEQKVCVMPLVSLAKDQTVSEGQNAVIGVHLNGLAPVYPLEVAFTVAGSADSNDHDLVDGTVVLTAGTEQQIRLTTTADNIAETNETLIVAINGVNLGDKTSHTISISEGNIAPEVILMAEQASETRLTITPDGGQVTIKAQVSDANTSDTHRYQWSASVIDIINNSSDEDSFVFDPASLAIGVYAITIDIADSGTPAKNDTATLYLEVVDTLAALTAQDSDGDLIPDNQEGYGDSDGDGIPDYLDRIDECNVLQEQAKVNDAYLVEGQAGVCLRRGEYTFGGNTGGAHITDDDVINNNSALVGDEQAINVGGIFDYIAYGLPVQGDSYAIVMPQRNPVPEEAVYRKYNEAQGWHFFVEDVNNSLWSTQGELGYCPPPSVSNSNNAWTQGLTAGHWCVQMVIEDGGVNDDDNQANGTVVDPGYVGALVNNNTLPVAENDNAELVINTPMVIDVLANDSDADGDDLIITSAIANIGRVVIENNQLHYTPPANYNGVVTVTYGISDSHGGSAQAQVSITIMPNLAPIAANEQSQIKQGETASLNLLANDTDPENDNLTLVSMASTEVGFMANGQATYTPKADFYGIATIHYTIEDSAGNQSQGQWQVTVIQVHQVAARTEGGGSVNLWLLLLLTLVTARVKLQTKG